MPSREEPDRERLEVIEAVGLTVRQGESGRGIDDVSFRMERGTLTVVVGRIGAGKTTLLRAVLGMVQVESGQVRWNGRPVPRPAGFMVPPRAAYTPQVPAMFSATLAENILLGLDGGPERLARAVYNGALDGDVADCPEGLDTAVGVRGIKLSGGQAQRAAAARMLVREPELLVVDDLSSALDVETERLVWDRLLAQLRTVLAVSHRRAVLERADQIVVLENGRAVAVGGLDEVLQASGEMRRLYAATWAG